MDGKQDRQRDPGRPPVDPSARGNPPNGPRFDSRTGRPIRAEPILSPGGDRPRSSRPPRRREQLRDAVLLNLDDADDSPASPYPRPPRPLRRRTFVRDLVLLGLHLAVYAVVIGGILYQLQFIGYGALSVRYASFDAIFWPAYAWGTLIAAQAGATIFQRRRFLGAIMGAMASVLAGTWVLGHFVEYEVTAIVFRSIAVALTALALGVSLVRRPPAFMLAEMAVPTPRSARGPVIAPARRSGFASFPGILLGMFALVFVLAGIAAGSYRALEVRGSGEAGQRDVVVPAFDRISASGTGMVNIRLGGQPGVSISGDANLIDYAEVGVRDGELHIDFDPGAGGEARLEQPLIYYVTAPSLISLVLGGDVKAYLDPPVDELQSLRVVAEDQAEFIASLLASDAFSAAVRNRASVTVSGRVEAVDIEADDNAVVDLHDLSTANATVTALAAARVLLGEATVLGYRQSGVALIQCAVGTEVLPGSEAEVPQCGEGNVVVPDPESVSVPQSAVADRSYPLAIPKR